MPAVYSAKKTFGVKKPFGRCLCERNASYLVTLVSVEQNMYEKKCIFSGLWVLVLRFWLLDGSWKVSDLALRYLFLSDLMLWVLLPKVS